MPLSPTGPISLALENYRDLLKQSATWQAWVGATTGTTEEKETAAKASTYLVDLPVPEAGIERAYTRDELSQLRPFSIVDTYDDPSEPSLVATQYSQDMFHATQRMMACFEADVPEDYATDPQNAKLAFLNNLGGVLSDLAALAGRDANLVIVRINILPPGVMRTAEEDVPTYGDRFCAWVLIETLGGIGLS